MQSFCGIIEAIMKRINIYIRDKQHQELTEYSKENEIKISERIRDAIDAELKRLKAEKRRRKREQKNK